MRSGRGPDASSQPRRATRSPTSPTPSTPPSLEEPELVEMGSVPSDETRIGMPDDDWDDAKVLDADLPPFFHWWGDGAGDDSD